MDEPLEDGTLPKKSFINNRNRRATGLIMAERYRKGQHIGIYNALLMKRLLGWF